MGGKIKRPIAARAAKKSKKEIVQGRSKEIENLGITKKELEKQKKLFSKMPLKAATKPSPSSVKKKENPLHHREKCKRTSPGEVIPGQGPNFEARGKKASQRAEKQILEKTRGLNKKMVKKTRKG